MKFKVGDILYNPKYLDIVKVRGFDKNSNNYSFFVLHDPKNSWEGNNYGVDYPRSVAEREFIKISTSKHKSLGLLLYS